MKEIQLFSHAIDSKSRTRTARAFGIDLGTTNSSVAEASWASGEKPVCGVLEIDQPLWPAGTMTSSLVPSVVAVLDSDGLMIGEGAKRLRTRPQEANLFPERNLFYETKNDMGLRKTYHRAPESFNHSSKIAGHILRFLKDAVCQEEQDNPAHFCVTVAEVIRQRQLMNERVGIVVPKNKQVHGFATAMQERGIDIEKAVPPKRPGMPADFDFGNNLPKIATYHSAKGLTFDSVLLPKITESAFDNIHDSRLRQRMLFVGVARATQWVYLSTTKGMELEEFSLLKDAAAKNHLTIQDGKTSPIKPKTAQPDDDYDAPF